MQSRHSKLYCLCSRDIQNFIVCAIATFKTLLFVQSSHSKLFSLCVPSGAPYYNVQTTFKILSTMTKLLELVEEVQRSKGLFGGQWSAAGTDSTWPCPLLGNIFKFYPNIWLFGSYILISISPWTPGLLSVLISYPIIQLCGAHSGICSSR